MLDMSQLIDIENIDLSDDCPVTNFSTDLLHDILSLNDDLG